MGASASPTGLQCKRILGQVEQLRKPQSRDAITVEQFAAAQIFPNCVARPLLAKAHRACTANTNGTAAVACLPTGGR